MKKKLQLIAVLGILMLGCTKDFGDIIIDTFDFTFEGTNEDNGFVYQELTTTFDIVANRQVDESKFYFDYEILEGEGYFEDIDGNIYEGGEIELNRLNFEYRYVPTVKGTHRIMAKALDYRKNQKEVELEYIVDFAPFTALLNGGSNQYIINRSNDLELIMLSENISSALGVDYTVSYSIDGGIGTIRLNGESVDVSNGDINEDYETLSVGSQYMLKKGSTELEYYPTTLGTHTITMTCTSPDGQVKIVKLEILVENVAFFINADPETNNGAVGEDLLINISLQSTDIEDLIDYEIVYYFAEDSNGSGIIRNDNNKIIASAAQYSIEPGTYSYVFSSDVVGRKKIYFDISDSNNQIKRDSVQFNYATTPFTFTGSSPNSNIDLNQGVPINYILSSVGGENLDYTFSYRREEGNGNLTDGDGNVIQPTTNIDVVPGNFSYNYTPTTTGEQQLVFNVTDNFGQVSTVSITFNVGNSFSFNSAFDKNTYTLDENSSINFNVVGNGTYTATYGNNNDGVLTYNGTSYPPGASFIINTGVSTGSYQAFTEGVHGLNFSVTSNTGETRTAAVSATFNAIVVDYTLSFSASEEINNLETGENTNINFNVTGNEAYTATYSNTNVGVFVFEGNIISPGQSFAIVAGNSVGIYNGSAAGEHDLIFTVTSNSGVTATDNVSLNYQNTVDNSIVFTAEPVIGAAETDASVNIIFNLTGVENYSASYTNNSTGSFFYNGNIYGPGESFSIPTGTSTATYTGIIDGMHTLDFTVVSNTGASSSDSVAITYTSGTIAVDGVSLNPSTIDMGIGSNFGLTAEVSPVNATNQNVTWSSGNNSVATINQTGVVTGVSAGTVTISVTTEDGGFTATSTITVQAATVSVSGVSVNPTSRTITEGNTTSLTSTVSPNNATNQNVTWSSSNNGVATVSATGVVTGVSAGTATITVTTQDGGFTATSTITVQAAIDDSIIEVFWAVNSTNQETNVTALNNNRTHRDNVFTTDSAFQPLTIRAEIVSNIPGASGVTIGVNSITVGGQNIYGTTTTISSGVLFNTLTSLDFDRRNFDYAGARLTIRYTISNTSTSITYDRIFGQD